MTDVFQRLTAAQARYEARDSASALDLLAPIDGPGDLAAEIALLRSSCLRRLHRFTEAVRVLDEAAVDPAAPAATILAARAWIRLDDLALTDRAIIDFQRARSSAKPPELAAIDAGLALAWCRKGCTALSDQAMARARAAWDGRSSLVPRADSYRLLVPDRRDAWRRCVDEVAAGDDPRLETKLMAFRALVDAQPERAAAELDRLQPLGDDELLTRRMRLWCLSQALAPPDQLAMQIAELRRLSPRADTAAWDELQLAQLADQRSDLEAAQQHAERACALAAEHPERDTRGETAHRASELLGQLGDRRCAPLRVYAQGARPTELLPPGSYALHVALSCLGRSLPADCERLETMADVAWACQRADIRTRRCRGSDEELAALIDAGAVLIVQREDAVGVVTGFDSARGAALLDDLGWGRQVWIGRSELEEWLHGGCLALLRQRAAVPDDDTLRTLDRARRLIADPDAERQDDDERGRALLSELEDRLPGPLVTRLLLGADINLIESGADFDGEALGQRVLARLDKVGLDDPRVAQLAALYYVHCGDVEQARRCAPELPANAPPRWRYSAMWLGRTLHQLEQAERHGWTLLRDAPHWPSANYLMAEVQVDRGQLDLARHFVDAYRGIDGIDDRSVPYLEAILHDAGGEAKQAVQAYAEVLSLAPDHLLSHIRRGYLLLDLGRKVHALTHFEEAISIAEEQGDIGYAARAVWGFIQAGRPEQALHHALELQPPDDPDALTALGLALHANGQPAEGLDKLREALARDPDHAWASDELGRLDIDQRETWKLQADLVCGAVVFVIWMIWRAFGN